MPIQTLFLKRPFPLEPKPCIGIRSMSNLLLENELLMAFRSRFFFPAVKDFSVLKRENMFLYAKRFFDFREETFFIEKGETNHRKVFSLFLRGWYAGKRKKFFSLFLVYHCKYADFFQSYFFYFLCMESLRNASGYQFSGHFWLNPQAGRNQFWQKLARFWLF